VQVCLGKAGVPVGQLAHTRQGQREHSAFAYADSWLKNPERFQVSPDLPLVAGHQVRRAPTKTDSVFHFALADTAPDAWGRRVMARAHAKRRQQDPTLGALTEMDYLCAVDDFSRVGALRLQDRQGSYLQTVEEGRRATPPLLELERMYHATRAVETSQETTQDLRYLQGKGTSLGGMRPKCTVLDADGRLAIGKFPSVGDGRSVTRAEVLALRLAQAAGITAAPAHTVVLGDVPVAVIQRFDRTAEHGRIPYLSAASMLQASREEDHAYTEVADAIRAHSPQPTQDVQQLWRRLVFNLLITNVDDHLQNMGFLHQGQGFWSLAPAFDLNPFPDKDRESKTWLSPDQGPITSVGMLLQAAPYFSLTPAAALAVLAEVVDAVGNWRTQARHPAVGLSATELADFANAFEHEALQAARRQLGR
jgi:serine/threonine-protein kinase HipA